MHRWLLSGSETHACKVPRRSRFCTAALRVHQQKFHKNKYSSIMSNDDKLPLHPLPAFFSKSLGDSDPYCIVKWGGVELGRTKTCPNTHEPYWGKERFRLTLPAEDATEKKDLLPLVLEVWDEDAPGTRGDFLGQVCPNSFWPGHPRSCLMRGCNVKECYPEMTL